MPQDEPITVVVADDERIVRDGLQAILQSQPGIAVVATAGDGDQALQVCSRLRPRVLMLDVRMPGRDGLWVLAELRRRNLLGPNRTQVLMLTTFDADEYVDEALDTGASGFLLKSSSYEELVAGVRAVAAGQSTLSPAVTRRLVNSYIANLRSQQADPVDLARLSDLTVREREVLELIGDGLSNAEIAERLIVTEHTVKTHVSRLLTKTSCRDRGQAAALARRTRF
jgi:DNA-binding NarL/FixJ family response regulator